MPMLRPTPHASGNRLLARLPLDEYARLSPHLQLINLKFKQILYEAQAPIEHAYFPIRVVLSAMILMENGNAIEVATTGNEGMVGLPALFRAETSLTHVFVQIAGDALQIRADTLKEEGNREGPFRRLLISYQSAFLRKSHRAWPATACIPSPSAVADGC